MGRTMSTVARGRPGRVTPLVPGVHPTTVLFTGPVARRPMFYPCIWAGFIPVVVFARPVSRPRRTPAGRARVNDRLVGSGRRIVAPSPCAFSPSRFFRPPCPSPPTPHPAQLVTRRPSGATVLVQ